MKTEHMTDSTVIGDNSEDLLLQIVVVNNITHHVTKIGCKTPAEFKAAMRDLAKSFLDANREMMTIHIGDWREN